jgi:hypothetical protein
LSFLSHPHSHSWRWEALLFWSCAEGVSTRRGQEMTESSNAHIGKAAKLSPPNLQMPRAIAAVRWVHGYSVTFYDASPANAPKNLRRQSGRFYDQKEISNTSTL